MGSRAYLPKFLHTALLTHLFLFVAVCASTAGATAPAGNSGASAHASFSAITERDAALVREAFHMQRELGASVWPGWEPAEGPLVFRTGTHEVVFGTHPAAGGSGAFDRVWSDAFGDSILVRASVDTARYRAAFPFEGAWAAVLSRPDPDEDPAQWVLHAVHELFHVWQARMRPGRVIDPFVDGHAGENELTFPYPHDDPRLASLARLEAEHVFRICTADSIPPHDARITVDLLRHVGNVASALHADALTYDFKRWMEWNEGVARYTERELALHAATRRYTPSREFAAQYPGASYEALRERSYARALNPIRFIGEGVRGPVTFYYMGMGKAYLLDRLLPEWKALYFERGLDALIREAKSAPACAIEP